MAGDGLRPKHSAVSRAVTTLACAALGLLLVTEGVVDDVDCPLASADPSSSSSSPGPRRTIRRSPCNLCARETDVDFETVSSQRRSG